MWRLNNFDTLIFRTSSNLRNRSNLSSWHLVGWFVMIFLNRFESRLQDVYENSVNVWKKLLCRLCWWENWWMHLGIFSFIAVYLLRKNVAALLKQNKTNLIFAQNCSIKFFFRNSHRGAFIALWLFSKNNITMFSEQNKLNSCPNGSLKLCNVHAQICCESKHHVWSTTLLSSGGSQRQLNITCSGPLESDRGQWGDVGTEPNGDFKGQGLCEGSVRLIWPCRGWKRDAS